MFGESKKYDYLIVGAGFFGAICAYELNKQGKSILVLEKRNHIGGNCYTENIKGIEVHKYGPHIFHTDQKWIWDWINQFAEFNNFKNSPIANINGEIYSLPFNMYTYNQLWGVTTPKEAYNKIEEQKYKGPINNLEEQALALVGKDIYEKLIKGYIEKQWGKKCTELPASIIKRLPVRFTWDNNYFNDKYQGIPIGGYTQIFEKLLSNIEIKYNVDYLTNKESYNQLASNIIYTGPIDAFFNYSLGKLEYKSIYWESTYYPAINNFQGNAVVNYPDINIPYTRIIEHKHFDNQNQTGTFISYEYPQTYSENIEPFYPVNDYTNNKIYESYKDLASKEANIIFGGRLAEYKYYDMHQIIQSAYQILNTLNN